MRVEGCSASVGPLFVGQGAAYEHSMKELLDEVVCRHGCASLGNGNTQSTPLTEWTVHIARTNTISAVIAQRSSWPRSLCLPDSRRFRRNVLPATRSIGRPLDWFSMLRH